MTPAQLQLIERIFDAASKLEPQEVNAFLEKACHGDKVLHRRVEALLVSRETATNFIQTSAAGLATRIMQRQQASSLNGRVIGHYRISHPVGAGGMGDVYLASDTRASRKAALKLLPARFAGDSERLQRFRQEAQAVAALNHPNILTIYEVGEVDSTFYIASELIEGETLRQRLARGRLELDKAVEIAIQVGGALAAAHDAGIIHRDIKPENIMVRPDGYVKVLDFGLAKLSAENLTAAVTANEGLSPLATSFGSILGTVRYMSPEQARGAQVSKTTDMWSLGAVLYEMVTGQAAFNGNATAEVVTAILETEPPPLTSHIARVPAELQRIVSKALSKNQSQRYQSAPELLDALKSFRREIEVGAELRRRANPRRSWRRAASAAAMVATLAALLAFLFYFHRNPANDSLPQKSIAVLPFENLSKDEGNAFFAGGVQDEILTDLARIADLKVISRTSVMKYKSNLERNLRDVAKVLGVAYVVEGSVQRAGERVRVNVQLIDARSDVHLWAQDYDREVADVFATQTEIAQEIADQLQARFSPGEKAAIAERPTSDLVAYAYYEKAREIDINGNWEGAEKSFNQKVELLEKAVQHDPNFALAYCELAKTQIIFGYLFGDPEHQTHLKLGKEAIQAALRLRPDLPEAHLELARYYFYAVSSTGNTGYKQARDELAFVRRKLPNNADALMIEGLIDRHENRWDVSLANLQRASELDPRNSDIVFRLEQTCFEMRRYSELEQILKRSSASGTQESGFVQTFLAMTKLAEGDPAAAQSLLEQVPLDYSPDSLIWETRFTAALYLHDYKAANEINATMLAKLADSVFGKQISSWAEGQVARARGDKDKARAAFAAARRQLETKFAPAATDATYWVEIARLDAGLGRREEAIREARRAAEILPTAKDGVNGPAVAAGLALVYAWTGERDHAIEQLGVVSKIPGEGTPTYGDLRFNPCWDDLRGDPRFDKIVAAARTASR